MLHVQCTYFENIKPAVVRGDGNLEDKCISNANPHLIMQYAANPIKID